MKYNRWHPPPKHWKPFWVQRYNAMLRGIPFRLSFEEWLSIWKQSGKLSRRGRGRGKYCMARKGDKGSYEVGNVSIVTHSQNSRDVVPTPAQRKAMGAVHRGVPKSKAQRRKMSVAGRNRPPLSAATRRKMSISAQHRRAT